MHKVLIVDDERPARKFLAELVAACLPDSKIIQAENAQKALQHLQTDRIDLMFADIEMPGMTGLQMLEHLQSESNTTQLPYTFIITAFRKYEYAVKGFRHGILDYIEKPLHEDKIYNAVKLYLEKIDYGTIELKVHNGKCRIQIDKLLAIKVVSRGKVMVYTSDLLFPEVACSLSQLYTLLPSNFHYARRDCIVNVHAVKRYNLKTREIFIVCQNREHSCIVSRESMKRITALIN